MLISEKDRAVIREMFEELENPVRLVVFTQGSLKLPGQPDCMYCETVKLTQELAELSDKVSVEVVNFHTEKEKVEEYHCCIPAIAVVGEEDYGVRYYGIPRGYEFRPARRTSSTSPRGGTELSGQRRWSSWPGSTRPVHIQVFVTPTCPYCPPAVRLAHRLAPSRATTSPPTWWRPRVPRIGQGYGVLRSAEDGDHEALLHSGGNGAAGGEGAASQTHMEFRREPERVRRSLRPARPPASSNEARKQGTRGSSEGKADGAGMSLCALEAPAEETGLRRGGHRGRPGGLSAALDRLPRPSSARWCWT